MIIAKARAGVPDVLDGMISAMCEEVPDRFNVALRRSNAERSATVIVDDVHLSSGRAANECAGVGHE
jgi:hypothetical protein